MKRLSSLAAVAFFAAGLQAQQTDNVHTRAYPHYRPVQHGHPLTTHPATDQGDQRDAVFSEDFANGLAGNNGFGSWSTAGTNGDVWRYTHTGPVGMYSDPEDEIISSPSVNNGFVIFNNDSANTDFTQDPPVMIDPPVVLTGSLVSPVLDLSANPAVEIRFTEQYRFCCGTLSDHFLDISTDGGTTWPTQISLDHGVGANTEWTSSETAVSIASAISADPGNVRFRFTLGDAEGNSHYYWEIDDISINPLPGNELDMQYGYTAEFGGGYEFGRVPQSQLLSTINVGASIYNYGGNTQNNVTVNVSLTDASNAEIAATSIPLGTIDSGDTMVADAMLTVPSPMATGLYTAHFTMTSDSIAEDQVADNNEKTRYFEVTDDLYSLDGIDVLPDDILSLDEVGTASFADNTQDVRFLNYYEVHSTMSATGVEIDLSSSAEAGSYFIASLYDTTSVLANDLSSPLAESDIHVITSGDIAAGKASVAFFDPITLSPDGYYVSANLYQEGDHDLYILDDVTVPQPAFASILWIPNDDEDQHLYAGNGTAWGVRLSSDPSVSVREHAGLQGVSIYPNPSNGLLNIHMQAAGNTSVEVFNVLGETVKTASFNGTSTTLDLSGNAAGIYSVRVGNGSAFTVQRIALN
jgi:hypothetical protein